MTRIIARLSLLASAALLLFAGSALANEKCATCHADIVASHKTTLHGKAGKDCLSCHGGGDAHIANPSKKNIISFGKKGSPLKEQDAACQQCHGKNQKLMFWGNSKHKSQDVSCASCHTVHKSPKPYAKQPEKCFECHKNVRAEANKFSHHPIIEGKVKCADCHNPHGSMAKAMVKSETVNQLCYKCHADKRGPFIQPHAPVEEDCMICHAPHGTKAAKLTREKVPNLCQNCHQMSTHSGTFYDKNGFYGNATSSSSFKSRACLNCHGSIHGTNAPLQQSFGR